MTERDFLRLINDIDDKFVKEEIEENNIPAVSPTEVTPMTGKGFSWGKIAGVAAACVVVIGGLACIRGTGVFVPNNTESETTTAEITTPAETTAEQEEVNDEQPVLYETKLNCNDISYDVKIRLRKDRSNESLSGEPLNTDYIWGDVSMELSLNGEVKDLFYLVENCYGIGQVGGVPFNKETLGNDYFKVLNMEQDVLAYITPNSPLGSESENDGLIFNAQFYTVNEEGKIAHFERIVSKPEKEVIGTGPRGELTTSDRYYFKIPSEFEAKYNRIECTLNGEVKNPWIENGTVFEPGEYDLYLDFQYYRLGCDDRNYKYLTYHTAYFPDREQSGVLLMDGSIVPTDEVNSFGPAWEGALSQDSYGTDYCFVVPFGTPAEKRAAGEEGDWIKLEKGDKVGDLTVEEASSYYSVSDLDPVFPYSYVARVWLSGQVSFTGTAEITYYVIGTETGDISIVLDEESSQKLFGLKPSFLYNGTYYMDFMGHEEETIHVHLPVESDKFSEIYDSLEKNDTVKVRISGDSFYLFLPIETGNSNDGKVFLYWDDIVPEVEILENDSETNGGDTAQNVTD